MVLATSYRPFEARHGTAMERVAAELGWLVGGPIAPIYNIKAPKYSFHFFFSRRDAARDVVAPGQNFAKFYSKFGGVGLALEISHNLGGRSEMRKSDIFRALFRFRCGVPVGTVTSRAIVNTRNYELSLLQMACTKTVLVRCT